MSKHVVILGGGLAGLSCGYELCKAGHRVTILEREPFVGGMASSFVENEGSADDYWCYDYGPHRFHTKDEELIAHIKEVIDGKHVAAKRLSRIFQFGKFFDYPLKGGNILRNLPPHILLKAMLDYLWVQFLEVTRIRKLSDDNFENWTTRRFGKTLYQVFFGQYTEKAWKMPPSQISADWASQRITLLNLWDTVKKTLFKPSKKNTPRTLVTDFVYPEYGGIGEIARGYARKIQAMGSTVLVGNPAIKVHRNGTWVTKIEVGGQQRTFIEGDEYISTIPITSLARAVTPVAPKEVQRGLSNLKYVSIVFVYLKIDKPQVSPDNWVYLPEKHLTVHRISEFKNFSPKCAPEGKTLVCAEITCRAGDEIWRADPQRLEQIAVDDLAKVGLIQKHEVIGSFVKKIPFAYPVYDLTYTENLTPVRDFINTLENIKTGGRQGLFRYNNMDQSVEMGRKMAWELATGEETGHEAVATGQEYFG
jgi:protoporphyrinogen oxidase